MTLRHTLKVDAKYQRAPDMIYSFKNIGKAEITGVQAEVQQKIRQILVW